MGLTPDGAVAVEFGDKAFTTEHGADERFSGFADLELQRVVEGNDVAGVDGVFSIDFDRVDGAEAVEDDRAGAVCAKPSLPVLSAHSKSQLTSQ